MDFRAFLSSPDPIVLPYFGGTRVDAADRRWRVSTTAGTTEKGRSPEASPSLPLAAGWWRFRIDGRRAVPLEPATPTDLSALPAMRGHYVDGWVVANGRELGRIALPPDDEPAPLARVTARRWYSGDWLFDTTDFEDDAELDARHALEARQPLGALKGVVPSLRAAFGYGLGLAAARELKIPMTIRELQPIVVEIAEGGVTVVRQLFDDLVEARRAAEVAQRERERRIRLATAASGARVIPRAGNVQQRCEEALEGANARMIGFRRIARGEQVEVTYLVDGTRLISVVEPTTLQVLDPGMCLDGEHYELTLDAMPSVVREAIEEDHLNITRHG